MATTSYHAIKEDGWCEYLRARGVFDEAIAARGYRWVHSGKPLGGDYAKSYGFPQELSGLLIPLHPLRGGDAHQLRPSSPQPDKKGHVRKFLTPYTQANTLNTSPLIDREDFKKKGASIIVAEGITRVDALAAYGIPALGLVGTYGWRGRNDRGGKTALPDWEEVSIKGSNFLIAFDGDLASNLDVWRAADRLCRFLRGKGADTVKVLGLPDNAGLDDWIATNGPFDNAEGLLDALKPYNLDVMPPRPLAPSHAPARNNANGKVDTAETTELNGKVDTAETTELNGEVGINGTRRLKILPYHSVGMQQILNDLKLEVRKNVRARQADVGLVRRLELKDS